MFFYLISKKKLIVVFSIIIAVCFSLTAFSVTVNGVYAKTKEDRIIFLQNLGYTVDTTYTEEINKITIPLEFNDVYNNYNNLQTKSGYDLYKFRGEELYQYTLKIIDDNYPDDDIFAHILQKNGKIVGGDIASVALNGFMKGLIKCD